MREYLTKHIPESLVLIVKRVVRALRCTYPKEKETAYSLELRRSGRVRYAVRRGVNLANASRTVLYQLEKTDRTPNTH